MSFPNFTAELAVYKSVRTYRTTHSSLPVRLGVLPQQGQDCFRICTDFPANNQCFWECSPSSGDGLPGPRPEPPGPSERSGCFRDGTSSTGWRLRECYTLPGSSGQATHCLWTDECPKPGCGPCSCTFQPDGRGTCTHQCFRYGVQANGGQRGDYTRSCKPTTIGPPPPRQ